MCTTVGLRPRRMPAPVLAPISRTADGSDILHVAHVAADEPTDSPPPSRRAGDRLKSISAPRRPPRRRRRHRVPLGLRAHEPVLELLPRPVWRTAVCDTLHRDGQESGSHWAARQVAKNRFASGTSFGIASVRRRLPCLLERQGNGASPPAPPPARPA